MSERKLDVLIERKVNSALRQALSDPDFGLEFKPSFVKEMKKRLQTRPKKLIPFEQIKRKYALA